MQELGASNPIWKSFDEYGFEFACACGQVANRAGPFGVEHLMTRTACDIQISAKFPLLIIKLHVTIAHLLWIMFA